MRFCVSPVSRGMVFSASPVAADILGCYGRGYKPIGIALQQITAACRDSSVFELRFLLRQKCLEAGAVVLGVETGMAFIALGFAHGHYS